MERLSKCDYYLNIAEAVAKRSTCLRRKFGAVIVNHDSVVSTGYNGAPRGRENCCELGHCFRKEHNIPAGQRYELCRSVHAEANAIIEAPRSLMLGAVLYLVGIDAETNEVINHADSCSMCKRQIINAGIGMVVIRSNEDPGYKVIDVEDWIKHDDSLIIHEGY